MHLHSCQDIYLLSKLSGGGYSEYPPFLKNKAKRLIIPYVFAMLIWVAPISVYFFDWDLMYITKKYLLAINPSQLWFLWMLFWVFAIVWPLKDMMIKKPANGYLISIVFYGIGVIGNRIIPNVFCIWTALQYIPFFFMGIRIRVKEENGEKILIDTVPWFCWIAIDLFLLVCSIAVDRQEEIIWKLISNGMSFMLHIVGAIMAWTTLQMLANKIEWQDSNIFKALSAYSMPMYLFHQQIIYFTIVWLNGKVNPWANAGINFVVALIGSFVISYVLMKWKTTRILIGEE